MSSAYRKVSYQDELLADDSVRRLYSDGRVEWRRKSVSGNVTWEDDAGQTGMDELLGNGVVKRSIDGGDIIYGKEQGYGRTAWSDGVLTINRSSFGGKVGGVLMGLGAGMLLGSIIAPPLMMSLEEEEFLRRQLQAQQEAQARNWSDSGGDFDLDFG